MKRRYIFRRQPDIRPIILPRKIIQISAGQFHSMCLDNNGQSWGWGFQQCNELGNNMGYGNYLIPTSGHSNNFYTKIMCGGLSTYLIDEYKQVWNFGLWDEHSQCYNYENKANSTAIFVDGDGWVFDQKDMTCLDNTGQLWIINLPTYSYITSNWTINDPVKLFTGYTWSAYSQEPPQLATGHACAIGQKGLLWSWGAGDYGSLGQNDDGDWTSSSVPIQVYTGDTTTTQFKQVACGVDYTHAITISGVGWSWGCNRDLGDFSKKGMLGTGDSSSQEIDKPTLISGGLTWKKIDVGYYFSIGLDIDGNAWGWGINYNGQLGLGFTGGTFEVPKQVIGSHIFVDICCGNSWVLAIDDKGVGWSWGSNGENSSIDGFLGINYDYTTIPYKHTPTKIEFPTT